MPAPKRTRESSSLDGLTPFTWSTYCYYVLVDEKSCRL